MASMLPCIGWPGIVCDLTTFLLSSSISLLEGRTSGLGGVGCDDETAHRTPYTAHHIRCVIIAESMADG